MYDTSNLKGQIRIDNAKVECPVKNCTHSVSRQRNVFKRLNEFKCPVHGIYISPSTFEYQDKWENILWTDETNRALLERICGKKRETGKLSRDNSEDAVTWNVFRYLEQQKLLQSYLSKTVNCSVGNPKVIYWSFSQSEGTTWSELQETREKFETQPKKGSEPDLIIQADGALFFIEAKLTASNKTVLKSKNSSVEGKYQNGNESWYQRVFKSRFSTIAVEDKKYELLRFWLLGSKIAHNLNSKFFLVNLVLAEKEKDIEAQFKRHIRENEDRTFLRITWEDIYHFISETAPANTGKEKIIGYFKNKTIGYDSNRHLRKAFSL